MKISKKILALILSLSVILSGFSIVTQANTETSNVPVPLSSEEFSVLKAFGFIGEDIAGLYNDSKISRAQFVGTLFKVAGFSEAEYGQEELYFNDVTAENLYKDEIQYFYEAGLINGTAYKTFSPANPITYKQAVKVILDVLGYKDYIASKYANVMDGYIAMAQKLELCQGFVIGNVDAPLTAQNAMRLLYNAGLAKVFEPTYYNTDGNVGYDFTSLPTLFEKNHRLYYSEGTMQSNGLVSTIDHNAPDNLATINGRNYYLSGCDLTGLVGLHVQFFYKRENGNDTIMWACASSKNNMIDIKASMLDLDNPKYDHNTVVYKSGKKAIELEISDYASLIYNNTLYNGYEPDAIKPEMGFIRLVENSGDKEYDLVIVEEHKNAFITGASTMGPHVANKYNEDINLPEYDNVVIYDDGKEITVSEIGNDTLVTYIADKSKKNIVIYVNRSVGMENLIGASVEDGETTLEFESGLYQYSPSYANLDPAKYDKITPRPGKKYIYYLDREGNIAEIQEQGDDILEYALVIDAYQDDAPLAPEGSAYFRLLLSNGNFVTAKSKKKMKILENGTKTNATGADVYNDPRLWTTEKKDGIDVTVVKRQVVRVTLNSDGELAEWEFAYDNRSNEWGHDTSKFSLDYISNATEYDSVDGINTVKNRYVTNGTTTCFVEWKNSDMEEPYGVIANTQVSKDPETLSVYDADENHIPAAIFAMQDFVGALASPQNMFLVDSIKYKLVDGDYEKFVCGYVAGTWTEYREFSEGKIPADLKEGDIVRFDLYDGKVVAATKHMNILDTTPALTQGTRTGGDNYDRVIYSHLYSISESTISVLTPDAYVSTYGRVITSGFSTLSVIPVTIYDTRTGEIKNVHPLDISPNQVPEANGEFTPNSTDMMVVINRKSHGVNDIIVVLR